MTRNLCNFGSPMMGWVQFLSTMQRDAVAASCVIVLADGSDVDDQPRGTTIMQMLITRTPQCGLCSNVLSQVAKIIRASKHRIPRGTVIASKMPRDCHGAAPGDPATGVH